MQFQKLLCIMGLAGLPANLTIVSSGRGAQRLQEDMNDVIMLTKRFASDQFLIQDSGFSNGESLLYMKE